MRGYKHLPLENEVESMIDTHDPTTQTPCILIVDDEEAVRDVLSNLIGMSGYTCLIASTGEEALEILAENVIDVVITDIKMPNMDGIELLGIMRRRYDADVIVMTGYSADYSYEKIIEMGARDFISKPFSRKEMHIRVKRVLRERMLSVERERAHRELKDAYIDTISRLGLAAEYKDEDTGDHIVRMSRYSALLGEVLGLPAQQVQTLFYAAPMHDIGKIGIPDSILLKPGKLTDEEFRIVQTHTLIGAKILSNPRGEVLCFAGEIALSHHEKWNGKGYPHGLAGDDIPLTARIVGIADVFDALTSVRPYKNPYPPDVALDIIRKERGEHFDPDITDAFLENAEKILRIRHDVSSVDDVPLTDFRWSERDQEDPPIALASNRNLTGTA